jgi:hypothetical protein
MPHNRAIIKSNASQRQPSIGSCGNASHQATKTKKMESHMTFYLESKNQDPSKVRRDGVSRAGIRTISKKSIQLQLLQMLIFRSN